MPTKIEWTDEVWNAVRGCTKCSPGCKHCYAHVLAERFRGVLGHPYEQGFDLRLVPHKLIEPYRWLKPKMVFVNSMSDFFHEGIPTEYIEAMVLVMLRANWHTYQILTKRSARMCELLSTRLRAAAEAPHIWWGVSVENRQYGLPRIADLQRTPAAVRFLSVEPLLENMGELNLDGIHSVIVGGESGRHARPMKREWVVSLREQCHVHQIPFFFKQWGGTNKKKAGRMLDGKTYDELPPRISGVTIPPRAQRLQWISEVEQAFPKKPPAPKDNLVVITPKEPPAPKDNLVVITPKEPPARETKPTITDRHDPLVEIEKPIAGYIYHREPEMHLLPLSSYVALTHCWDECFDVVPYLQVSSLGPGMGKSVFLELLSYLSHEGVFRSEMTVASMQDLLETTRPALYLDEFEYYRHSHEHLAIFNSGYKRSGSRSKMRGKENVVYSTYCPKAFGLIGNLVGPLLSRCINIYMVDGEAPNDYDSAIVKSLARPLRERLHTLVTEKLDEIRDASSALHNHPTMQFLKGREREIWKPLFAVCQALAPQRIPELTEAASFLTARKSSRYFQPAISPKGAEEARTNEQVRRDLLADIIHIMNGRDRIRTLELIPAVQARNSKWRGYEDNTGQHIDLTQGGMQLFARLLKPFGVEPEPIKFKPNGSLKGGTARGLYLKPLLDAATKLGIIPAAEVIPSTPETQKPSPTTPLKPRNPVTPKQDENYGVTESPTPTRGGARRGAGRKPVPRACPWCRQIQPSTHAWLAHKRNCPQKR